MTITSRDNETVRTARRLAADPKARREAGAFLIEGARLCADAALSGALLQTALITEAAAARYPAECARITGAAARVFTVTDRVAAAISDTTSPQGVFCICKTLDNRKMLDKIEDINTLSFNNSKWLALENLRDPGNLGTVIRTAEAVGIGGLILSAGCCDLYSPKVLRGSMGGVFRLPLFETGDLPALLRRLQDGGCRVYGCVPDRQAASILDLPLGPGTVCVVGNEANGLTPAAIAACSGTLTIPMAGRAESLNAAVAASLVMWEMMRR